MLKIYKEEVEEQRTNAAPKLEKERRRRKEASSSSQFEIGDSQKEEETVDLTSLRVQGIHYS